MVKAAFESIGAALRDGALALPDKTAVITPEHVAISYAALDAQVDALAKRLVAAGVAPGDRIAVLSRNSVAMIALLFATTRAGAIFVPVNWRLAPPEIAFVLSDATPTWLFVSESLLPLVADVSAGRIAVVRDDDSIDELPNAAPGTALPVVGAGDPALLVYTSGTSGQPKAAVLTHASFERLWNLDTPAVPDHVGLSASDSMIVSHPLFHIGTIEPLLRVLFNRATVVLHREFDPATTLAATQRHRVTVLGVVPTALQMLLRHPDCAGADLSSVRRVYYGASPIPAPLLVEALDRFDAAFVQAYGMTEMGGTCVMLAPEDHVAGSPRLLAAGKPILNAEAKVIDPDGATLPPGTIGEIAVRGGGMMAGYWRQPDATAAAIDADGWLRTGDAGELDADGYVYVKDRVKDMIISGGENIYPAEVESALFGHPAIEEVVVVGVPDPLWGEAVKAVVVAKPGAEVAEAEVLGWARTRIAAYKIPKTVDVVAELPKSAAGKILRRVVRAPYWQSYACQVN